MFLIKNKFLLLVLLTIVMLACQKEDNPTETVTTGSISGYVIGLEDNSALAKVLVSTSPASSTVTTSDDGSYLIENVEEGEYEITASKNGYNESTTSVKVLADKITTADFTLKVSEDTTLSEFGYIEGIVRDNDDNTALANVNIITDPVTYSVTSSSTGLYLIKNLDEDVYEISAFKKGYDTAYVSVNVTLGDTTISDIFMSKTDTTETETKGSIQGIVTNDSTNQAIAGVLITTDPGTASVLTASDGTYEINNISYGSYTVMAEKSGYTSKEVEITVEAGETTTADFNLVAESD